MIKSKIPPVQIVNAYTRKALKWGAIAYAVAFLGVNTHIIYDYNTNGPKKPELTLQVHKYNVDVKGKHKELTLVGEVHRYNSEDKKVAENLVLSNHFFMNECNRDNLDQLNGSELIYLCALSLSGKPSTFYYYLGSGREFPSISHMAEEQGRKVYALEEGFASFTNLSTLQNIGRLAKEVITLPLAPLCYYGGKNEPKFTQEYLDKSKYFCQDGVVDKRDKDMAGRIVLQLQQKEIHSLLATTGLAHTYGIIKHLKSNLNIKLEEIR